MKQKATGFGFDVLYCNKHGIGIFWFCCNLILSLQIIHFANNIDFCVYCFRLRDKLSIPQFKGQLLTLSRSQWTKLIAGCLLCFRFPRKPFHTKKVSICTFFFIVKNFSDFLVSIWHMYEIWYKDEGTWIKVKHMLCLKFSISMKNVRVTINARILL